MQPDRWQRVKALFDEAVERTGDARRAFLEEECAGDPGLLAEVLSLLEEDEGDTWSLDRPASDDDETRDASEVSAAAKHRTIGPYRIVRRVGQGGMGDVYEAEQFEPVRRRVALKVIKRGMDTREVIARFELERQALALMNHRSIAQVFDAGTTPNGRPYFAMEFVDGLAITEYCDRHKLSPPKRLQLFLEVCAAVQHAHQKGIIHRDLKPSNVLVKVEGDQAAVKVIDFGVAKATSIRLTEKTLFTQYGQWVGTPEYMSPEQADPTSLDIDTRTDVYALGVVLYELMVGARPFDSASLRSAGFDEVRRVIREEEPPKPSTRLSSMGEAEASEAAENRQLNATLLRRDLRGDLDAIAMKCLAKDRIHRYGSPAELAADIERHLHHHPVLASPPGALYRVSKFVSRHRMGVALAAGFVVFLLAFAISMGVQSRRLAKERDRAEVEAARARAFGLFLRETILSPDPEDGLGREVTVIESLEQAERRITELADDQPEVEAAIRSAIGSAYLNLGRYEAAEPLLRAAFDTQKETLGEAHFETTETEMHLGELLEKRGLNEQAIEVLGHVVAVRRETLGPTDVRLAQALDQLSEVLLISGRYGEAEPLLMEALEIFERENPGSQAAATVLNKLGILFLNLEELDAAEDYLRQALVLGRTLHEGDRPQLGSMLNNLGVLLYSRKDFAEAHSVFREVVDLQRQLYGPAHDEVATALANLGAVSSELGDFAEAESLVREALAINRKQHGEDHVDVAVNLVNLGNLLREMKRFEEGCAVLADGLATLRIALGGEHWRIGAAQQSYGLCLAQNGDSNRGQAEMLAGITMLEATLGADSRRVEEARLELAKVRQQEN